MKITYRWLCEFIDTKLSPYEIADRLTLSGIEVSGVYKHNEFLKDVVVAEIKEIHKIEGSDKLSLCKVYTGEETLDIVCGATNMKPGDKVALAKIGAVLPGDFKIKKAKIRGTFSYGMLCSEMELGLSQSSEGIMILPEEAEIGRSVGEELELFDTVIEFEITPNRGDCLSVFGIARELAGITGEKVKVPEFELKEEDEDVSSLITVEIEEPELCPRYTARVIRGVNVSSSPLWMRNRLIAVGLRPINNVVDITNYLMIELGQPMHAFDMRFIKGNKIVVRRASDSERFTTLDGKEHILNENVLMICDAERSVAIAGIMGGLNSEVVDDTEDVLLEVAYFNPDNIRVSSKKLKIQTDASYRFERGVDIENVKFCSDRAAYLMSSICGGKVLKGIFDCYPKKYAPVKVKLREKRLNTIAGCDIPFSEAEKILINLGFKKENGEFVVPSWRHDVKIEEDLIEEVLRIYGYDRIPDKLPKTVISPEYSYSFYKFCKDVKSFFVSAGFLEAINYSFTNSKLLKLVSREEPIFLLNPLTEELEALRTCIIPSLLKNVADNFKYKNTDLRLFEIGKVFFRDDEAETGVREITKIGGVLTGKVSKPIWNIIEREIDFFDVKGVV